MTHDINKLRSDLDRAEAQIEQLARTMSKIERRSETKLAEIEGQIKTLEAEPATERTQRLLYLQRLRRCGVLCNQEMGRLFSQKLDMKNPQIWQRAFQANQARLEELYVKARFVSTEYGVINYQPVIEQIEAAIHGGQTGSLDRPGSGPLGRPGSGPLGQSRGTGPLGRGAAPARPGTGPTARPGSGPLGRPGTGPLGRPAGSGPLGAKPGTGPLSQKAAPMARAGGTAPLEASVPQGTGAVLQQKLAAAAANPEQRRLLEQLINQYREIDGMVAPLRSDGVGEFDLATDQVDGVLKAVAGKIYYLERTLQQLGQLGTMLAFETKTSGDENFQLFMAEMAAEKTPEPAAEKGGLASKLKSMFNLT